MKLAKFGRSEHGAAMVEFAIVAPLLFMLVFGIIDFGRALFVFNNLTNAAREGARFGATRIDPAPTTGAVQTAIRTRVTQYVNGGMNGTPTGYTVGIVANNQSVTVTIQNFPFQMLTPFANMLPGLRAITMPIVSSNFRWEGAT